MYRLTFYLGGTAILVDTSEPDIMVWCSTEDDEFTEDVGDVITIDERDEVLAYLEDSGYIPDVESVEVVESDSTGEDDDTEESDDDDEEEDEDEDEHDDETNYGDDW